MVPVEVINDFERSGRYFELLTEMSNNSPYFAYSPTDRQCISSRKQQNGQQSTNINAIVPVVPPTPPSITVAPAHEPPFPPRSQVAPLALPSY